MYVDEHQAMLDEQRSITLDRVIVKRDAIHRTRDPAIGRALDLGGGKEKGCARLEYARQTCKGYSLISACEVKHHPPRNRRVEATICERTRTNVAAYDGCARQIDPEVREHSFGAVESDDAMAGVYERLRDRNAVAAADVQNPGTRRQRGGNGECFRDAGSPAAIARIPGGNQIVVAHLLASGVKRTEIREDGADRRRDGKVRDDIVRESFFALPSACIFITGETHAQ